MKILFLSFSLSLSLFLPLSPNDVDGKILSTLSEKDTYILDGILSYEECKSLLYSAVVCIVEVGH